jgi:hypothetical protein
MELSRELAMELTRLEHQAARCGELLADADEELLAQVLEAFAPVKPGTLKTAEARRKWGALWVDWLRDAAQRWPGSCVTVFHR